MSSQRRSPVSEAMRRAMSSHVFVPLSLMLTLALAAGVGVNALIRAGDWPPALAQPRTSVIFSAPPSPSPTTDIHVIVLGAEPSAPRACTHCRQ